MNRIVHKNSIPWNRGKAGYTVKTWTNEEVNTLMNNYETMTYGQIGKLLNRKPHQIQSKLNYMKIKKPTILKETKIPDINQKNLLYTAGLIDGEGHIGISKPNKSRRTYAPILTCVNTNKEIIEWLSKTFNTSTKMQSMNNLKGKDIYKFEIYSLKDLRKTLTLLLPYLRIKKKQARLLLTFCQIRIAKEEHVKYRSPYSKEEHDIYLELKKLNKRGKSRGEQR